MKSVRLLFVLFIVVVGEVRAESADAPEMPTRFERFHIDYRLNDDSSHVESYEYAMTVLKDAAVEAAKRASVSYSTSIQKAEVLKAYTRKPDGRRIDAPKTNYQVRVNKGRNQDAPVFSDMTTLTVVFPEVAVGDTVVFAYKVTQTEPMFPGKFSVAAAFPRLYAYDDVKIRFDVPAKLWAQYEAREMSERIVEKGGRRVIEWTYQNKQPVKSKRRNYSVYDTEKEPGYAFSTFRSYAEIAEAYGVRARPKAAVTARVRQLADEIVAGKTAPREQARALYDWVATNITYAGNCIGTGAVVPHDISFILDNRMGDCKDHATLLQALLAAKGIESTQALVNAGSLYRLPRIPVVASVNHVINYIPSFDLYADSTAATIPFGMLPQAVAGKPVLWVDGFREATQTPVPPVGRDQQHMKTVARIGPDGSISGTVEVALKGMFAVETRASMRNMSKDEEEEMMKAAFRHGFGSGSMERPDAKELLDTYQYKVKFEMKEFVQRPGAGAFNIEPFYYAQAPIGRFTYEAVEPVEEVDVACGSGKSTEEYVYELPKGMKLLSVPDDVSISNDFLSYQATYKHKDNTLTVKRVFDDKTRGNVCSPDIMRAYQDFAKKALQDVRSQVVYK